MELFESIRWRPGISDPTPLGWLTVLAYAVVTIICAIYTVRLRATSQTEDSQRQVWAWSAITLVLFALGINKQLDLQTLLSQVGREIARTQGWYANRRGVQLVFILAIAVIGTGSIGALVYSLRSTLRRHWIAFVGLFVLLIFVVIRAVSFHYIDLFLYTNIIGDLKLSTGLELGSLILIGTSTYFVLREQAQTAQATNTRSVLLVSGGVLIAMIGMAVGLGFLSFLWPDASDQFEEVAEPYQHTAVLDLPTSEQTNFSATFSDTPQSPTPFRPSGEWDVTIHTRNWEDVTSFAGMDAAYGSDCQDPTETHFIEQFEDAVYLCNGRLTTAINGDGYGAVALTPNQLVDFSGGTAAVSFDLSTVKQSSRDWVEIWITPYHSHLQIPALDWVADLNGYPSEGIQIQLDNSRRFIVRHITDYQETELIQGYQPYDEIAGISPEQMLSYTLELSADQIRFGIPEEDIWWSDTTFETSLDWQMGIVQFTHHSFDPEKCDDCQANSWQWDNIEITPARPFTIIPATQRYVNRGTGTELEFTAPAPEQAYLRFMAQAEQVQISFNGGDTWQNTELAPFAEEKESAFQPYWTAVPEGTQQIDIRALDKNGHDWQLRDISIWSLVDANQ